MAGAVLTSATLTALGSFERILLRAGLPDDCLFATVPSPFDYRARACLAVPKLAADPGDPAAHTREVARWLEVELDQSQASLVLFASRQQMREVYDRVSLSLRDCVLLQDHFGKQELLRLHRQRVDAGGTSGSGATALRASCASMAILVASSPGSIFEGDGSSEGIFGVSRMLTWTFCAMGSSPNW